MVEKVITFYSNTMKPNAICDVYLKRLLRRIRKKALQNYIIYCIGIKKNDLPLIV